MIFSPLAILAIVLDAILSFEDISDLLIPIRRSLASNGLYEYYKSPLSISASLSRILLMAYSMKFVLVYAGFSKRW